MLDICVKLYTKKETHMVSILTLYWAFITCICVSEVLYLACIPNETAVNVLYVHVVV